MRARLLWPTPTDPSGSPWSDQRLRKNHLATGRNEAEPGISEGKDPDTESW